MAKNIFAFDKPKNGKKTISNLLSLLKGKALFLIVISLLLCFISNMLSLYGPKIIGMAINVISESTFDIKIIFDYVIRMLFVYITSSILILLINSIMAICSRFVAKKLREMCFDKLSRLPLSYFDHHLPGDILSRAFYDVDLISTSIATDFTSIMTSAISVIGSLVMMIEISFSLSSVVLITIPLSVLYTTYIKKKTKPLYKKRSAEYGEMNGYVEEIISGIKTIQAYSREDKFSSEYEEKNKNSSNSYRNAESLGMTIGPNTRFINNLSIALIAILGSVFYMHGIVSIGGISSFVLYSRKFSGPINEVANVVNEIVSALAASERIFNFLEEKEDPPDKKDAITMKRSSGRLDVFKLSFSYTKEREVLKDISFSLRKGETIAIVGPTGAGKTTLINLLLKFYNTDNGNINIDNISVSDCSTSSWRKQYSLVLQDTWLFSGTVFENISYGNDNVGMSDVVNISKKIGLHPFITRLKNGYNTVISEDGSNISKGQKQLLTVARAMLSSSPLLVLDEATSNVDSSTERKVQECIKEYSKGKGTIIIAHRLSTIKNADLILVFNNGEIVERGKHEELLNQKGFYFNLYNAQYK